MESIIGYKFFEKGKCELSGNTVCDERGFIFEEGNELKINLKKEWEENNLLPIWEMNRIIKSAIKEKGVWFHIQPSDHQFHPFRYNPKILEDTIFEISTIGFWIHPKPYAHSKIYSEHIKVLRKLTQEEFAEIYRGWFIKIKPETTCLQMDFWDKRDYISLENQIDINFICGTKNF